MSRPIVSRLISHAKVPGRKSSRDAIGTALGWEPGSCDAILAGRKPTLRGSALSAKVVAHRLEEIADEAEAAALESARAAALLALRGGAAVASQGQNGVNDRL